MGHNRLRGSWDDFVNLFYNLLMNLLFLLEVFTITDHCILIVFILILLICVDFRVVRFKWWWMKTFLFFFLLRDPQLVILIILWTTRPAIAFLKFFLFALKLNLFLLFILLSFIAKLFILGLMVLFFIKLSHKFLHLIVILKLENHIFIF